MMVDEYNKGVDDWCNDDGKTEVLGDKPLPASICPPQIPSKLTWYLTLDCILRAQRQTA